MAGITRNKNYPLTFIKIPLILVLLFQPVTPSVFCPLEWEVSGNGEGNLPSSSVSSFTPEIPGNSKLEYIARVFYDYYWIVGRLSLEDGKIHVGAGGLELNFSTYQVLTNPQNCLLSWKPEAGGIVPDFSVSTTASTDPESDTEHLQRDPIYYVGRAVIQIEANDTEPPTGNETAMAIGGNVDPSRKSISVGFTGQEVTRSQYQVLTSVYPKLHLDLSDLVFDIGLPDFCALEESLTKVEMIGEDTVYNSMEAVQFQQKIQHSKTFHETILLEEEFNWREISLINNLRFALWFGGSDVKEAGLVMREGSKTLRIDRDKNVSVDRDVTVNAKAGIQICSIANILSDPVIPFSAIGSFYREPMGGSAANSSSGIMTGDQVAKVLVASGRRVVDIQGDRVLAEVRGTLSGRFFIRSLSFISEIQSNVCGSCLSRYQNKWLDTTS